MRASTTRRQHDLLVFIKAYIAEHDGIAPSYDEMVAGLGMQSRSAVFWLVNRLVERGQLLRLPSKARSLRVVEATESRDTDRIRDEAWQEGYAAALRDHNLPAVKPSRVGPHSGAVKPGQTREPVCARPFSSSFNRV